MQHSMCQVMYILYYILHKVLLPSVMTAYVCIRLGMVGEPLSSDQVYVRSRFSILHVGVIGTHSMRKTREQFLLF